MSEGNIYAFKVAGLGIFLAFAGSAIYFASSSSTDIALARIKATPQIQEADLNNNGIPDKFYTINGQIAVVELDGRKPHGSLDSKVVGDIKK